MPITTPMPYRAFLTNSTSLVISSIDGVRSEFFRKLSNSFTNSDLDFSFLIHINSNLAKF